jgi:hypothetical protein
MTEVLTPYPNMSGEAVNGVTALAPVALDSKVEESPVIESTLMVG